jgi:8-amino-7-oxononanoate synthase
MGCSTPIFLDESAHYSLKDAARLSGVPVRVFRHCDTEDLRASLRGAAARGARPLVMTDGVFPVAGRIPPLHEYSRLISEYDGLLFVDETHAFGVLGEGGRGALEHCGVVGRTSMGATLSKAFCAQGAVLACSSEAARRIRVAPQALGASAGSPLSALASVAVLTHVSRHPEIRTILASNVRYLKSELRRIGIDAGDSPAPIAFFKCGSRREMLVLQRRVFERGINVGFVSNYVGCDAEGGLRCTVFRDHSFEDIDALIAAIG